jgi:hypothetical protein
MGSSSRGARRFGFSILTLFIETISRSRGPSLRIVPEPQALSLGGIPMREPL